MDINVLQKQNKAWNLLIYLKNKEHFGFSVKQELFIQHMFATPQLKCFESDAQTINYRRQHGAVDGGVEGTGVKVSMQSVL